MLFNSGALNTTVAGTGTISGATANADLFLWANTRKLAVSAPLIGAGTGTGFAPGFRGVGTIMLTNAANTFTGNVTVGEGTLYRAANATALGTTGNASNSFAGTFDVNGSTFAGEGFGTAANNGALLLPHLINTSATAATWGDATASSNLVWGGFGAGSGIFGGAGDLILASNITGTPTSGGSYTLKMGTGKLTLTGSQSVTFGGTNQSYNESFIGGGVTFDYAGNTGVKLVTGLTGSGTGVLTLQQNAFAMNGHASTSVSEAVATGTTLAAGASSAKLTSGTGAITLDLKTITRTNSGTIDFATDATAGGSATIKSTLANSANGIIGAFATWGRSGWAINDGSGNMAPLAAGGYADKDDLSTWLANEHITNNTLAYTGATGANLVVGSLRFNSATASTVTIGGGFTLALGGGSVSGGILVAASVGSPRRREQFWRARAHFRRHAGSAVHRGK